MKITCKYCGNIYKI